MIIVDYCFIIEKHCSLWYNLNAIYIRLGMYEYLLETEEHNSYVEYCLSGISLLAYELGGDDGRRIGNEAFELVNF